MKVLDSTASVDPAAARAQGFDAILRYLAGGSPLTVAELATYTGADFGVGSLWELQPGAVANGENQGSTDALAAVKVAQAIGQPKGSAIFFACDTDPAGLPGGPAGAVAYYRGASIVRQSGYLAGAYIGAAGANACLAAGVVDRIMVPNASSWSDGQTPKEDDIQQGYPYVVVAGVQYDPDTIPDPAHAGLWNGHGLWPVPPKPVPTPTPTPEVDMPTLKVGDHNALVQLVQQGLKILGFFEADPLGNFGAKTDAAVRAFQHFHNIPQGDFGSASWKVLGDRLSKVA